MVRKHSRQEMDVRRVVLAALAALTLGLDAGAAFAQPYYGGDDVDRPRRRQEYRYENRYDDERPRSRYEDRRYGEERGSRRERGYGEGYGRGLGRICVTARGNCPTRPAPVNASCGCEIPGFGFKRGAIGY